MNGRVELLTLDQPEWRMLGEEPLVLASRRELLLGDQVGALREVGAATAAFLARVGSETRRRPIGPHGARAHLA